MNVEDLDASIELGLSITMSGLDYSLKNMEAYFSSARRGKTRIGSKAA